VLDGPIDRNAFETYRQGAGSGTGGARQVVTDNLSSHKGSRDREMFEAASANLLYLQPYGPDYNPIEVAFSKLKAILRKAAERSIQPYGTPWGASSISSRQIEPHTCSPQQGMSRIKPQTL
jgi:transposase